MNKNIHYLEISQKANVPLAFWGSHGISKSATVREFARTLNQVEDDSTCVTFILSHVDPLEIGGKPIDLVDENGIRISDTAMPKFIQNLWAISNSGKIPVLFLDEMNRADQYCLNVAMSLVVEKQVKGHKLPPETFIVSAMNPQTEEDYDVNHLSAPLLSRFCHVKFEDDMNSWISWLEGTEDYNDDVVLFLRQYPQTYNTVQFDFQQAVGRRIQPNRRAYTYVNKILNVAGYTGATDDRALNANWLNVYGNELISGLIGVEATTTLISTIIAFNESQAPLTVEEMINPSADTLQKVQNWVSTAKTQPLILSLEDLYHKLPHMFTKTAEDDVWNLFNNGYEQNDKLGKFILSLPEEFQAAFWSMADNEDGENAQHNMAYWRGIFIMLLHNCNHPNDEKNNEFYKWTPEYKEGIPELTSSNQESEKIEDPQFAEELA